MSAFNWIEVQAECPVCRKSKDLRAQTHVASSFDGDERGRFAQNTYHLGERMWWWDKGDEDYDDWIGDALDVVVDGKTAYEEACYSTCLRCGARLVIVIRFIDLVPVAVVSVATEDNWPAGFPH